METFSDRHEGDAGGVLAPLASVSEIAVSVEVDTKWAGLTSTQQTAWMLVNLLARLERVVHRIDLVCPDVPLAEHVIAGAQAAGHLGDRMVERANAIGGVRVRRVAHGYTDAVHIRFVVGPGAAIPDAVRVYGDGWTGAMSPSDLPEGRGSCLPFGPYIAACLAAGHVFMQVRAKSPRPLEAYAYSAWSHRPIAVNFDDGPVSTPDLRIDAALGGVGAVGGAWLHALWALPNIGGEVVLADSDPEGVSISNLNRCVLFVADDVGESKATAAVRICANGLIDLRPFDQRLQDVDVRVPLVVSAVDLNTARAAVQGLYPPRLLSGSTSGLRAEILRCDPDAGTACIRCYNPPERDRPDDELRRQFRDAPIDIQRRMADELGIGLDEAVAWAVDGVCGYAADRLLAHLRGSVEGTRAFAVGFVSVSAGTLLAAQTVKELMGTARPFEGVTCRAHIVFLDPSDSRNGPTKLARDPECPMCDPATPAGRRWRRRYLVRSYTA